LGLEPLAIVVAFHLVLLCTLWAAALIQYDGHRVPPRLAWPAILVGAFAPMAWPWLRPFPALLSMTGWQAGLVDGLAGLLAGALVGLAAWALSREDSRRGLFLGLICAGFFLGWQPVLFAGVLTLIVHGVLRLLSRITGRDRTLPGIVLLFGMTLLWLLAWSIA
jgi:hypothetical protein